MLNRPNRFRTLLAAAALATACCLARAGYTLEVYRPEGSDLAAGMVGLLGPGCTRLDELQAFNAGAPVLLQPRSTYVVFTGNPDQASVPLLFTDPERDVEVGLGYAPGGLSIPHKGGSCAQAYLDLAKYLRLAGIQILFWGADGALRPLPDPDATPGEKKAPAPDPGESRLDSGNPEASKLDPGAQHASGQG